MTDYEVLTMRAQKCGKEARAEAREGRYREAFALRERGHTLLAEATRLRQARRSDLR